MKGYILTGAYYKATKVYVNREMAEKAKEKENYCIGCGGGYNFVDVAEVEIVTEEEG
jgi:hypothetical protein